MRKTWTDELLCTAVETSKTYGEVYEKLGLRGNRNLAVARRVQTLGLSVRHFEIKANRRGPQIKIDLNDILHGVRPFPSSYVKTRFLEAGLLQYHCYECGLDSWRGKYITLQLDHIDGDNCNNKLENVRLLCPNCHAQTPTYCNGKGQRRMQKTGDVCRSCGKKVSIGAVFCVPCAPTQKTERSWPPKEQLVQAMRNKGPLALSRELGVSRHMLYSHLRSIGFYG